MKVILIVTDNSGNQMTAQILHHPDQGAEMSELFLGMARGSEIEVQKSGGSLDNGYVDFAVNPDHIPIWIDRCNSAGVQMNPEAVNDIKTYINDARYNWTVRHQIR